MARPKRKTVTTTLKMTPEVKELWDSCAEAERRTLTNMFEMMVYDYSRKLGIKPSTGGLPSAQKSEITSK